MDDLEYLQSNQEKLNGYDSFISITVKLAIFIAIIVIGMYFFLT
ncbi:hypothetical protein N9K16_00415 [Alphaproteobacteria bacterium]|jgi:hypothetical protein|nr:hypothetical protein [Alphaproteobacteria bacterium]